MGGWGECERRALVASGSERVSSRPRLQARVHAPTRPCVFPLRRSKQASAHLWAWTISSLTHCQPCSTRNLDLVRHKLTMFSNT
eukprot:3559767-Pleurochrysis_carterae.AAC.3